MGKLLCYKLWVVGKMYPGGPQNNTGYCFFLLVDPSELDSKNLLLKTPHSLVTGHEKSSFSLLTFCLLNSFQRLRSFYVGFSGGNINSPIHLWALWVAVMTIMARYAYGCNSSTNVWTVTTAFSLDLRPTSWEERHVQYCRSCQEPKLWELTGSRSEPTTIIL